jgi:hypothetical protein
MARQRKSVGEMGAGRVEVGGESEIRVLKGKFYSFSYLFILVVVN